MDASVTNNAQETPRSLRKLREARAHSWQSLIVPAFVAFVVCVNLLFGAVVLYGSIQRDYVKEDTASVVRTAQVTRPLLDGTFCHLTVFDSTSSKMIEDKVERCDRIRHDKHTAGFNWGAGANK